MKFLQDTYNVTATTCSKGLLVAVMAILLVPLSAEAGNGNGNGKENANNNGNDNRNPGRNDRGQQASNLGRLNAANANENAFLNASPNSTPGQIQQYRVATQESSTLIAEQNIAAQDLLSLQELTEEEIAEQYPDGTFDTVLAGALEKYEMTTSVAQAAEQDRAAILATLSGNRTLTDSDIAAFHEMLGL